MKKIFKKTNVVLNLVLSILLISSECAYAQGGYQQPLEPEENGGTGSLYDQVLQQPRRPVVEQQQTGGFNQPFGDPLGSPRRPLRGKIVVVPAGTTFQAGLITTLSSGISRIGDRVVATVSTPVIVGTDVVIPTGSQAIGQVVNAIPAARFMGGSGGVLEIRFTALQTPDGQTYPISGSVDDTQIRLQAETGGSRVAKGVAKTAAGAGIGAALGTALGAIAGGKEGVGRGAWSGAAIGGGLGALGALASKGKELILEQGFNVPIRLDQSVQTVVPQRN